MCVARIEVAHKYLESFAQSIANSICWQVRSSNIDIKNGVKLPWGHRLIVYANTGVLAGVGNDYSIDDYKIDGIKSHILLIGDIEAGWLDRVDAFFDAPSQAARNRIAKEIRPSDVPPEVEDGDEE